MQYLIGPYQAFDRYHTTDASAAIEISSFKNSLPACTLELKCLNKLCVLVKYIVDTCITENMVGDPKRVILSKCAGPDDI